MTTRRSVPALALAGLALTALGAGGCGGGGDGKGKAGAGAGSGAAGAGKKAPAKPVGFATGKASGAFAIAQADGKITRPAKIEVVVEATPDQDVQVSYTLTCAKAKGVSSGDGQFSAKTPVTRPLKIPGKRTKDCIVAANGQMSKGGKLKVSLRGRKRG